MALILSFSKSFRLLKCKILEFGAIILVFHSHCGDLVQLVLNFHVICRLLVSEAAILKHCSFSFGLPVSRTFQNLRYRETFNKDVKSLFLKVSSNLSVCF